MLKFIKHNMETIIGIEIFPLISFIIFFLFFLVLFIWVAKLPKTQISQIAHIPLEEDEPNIHQSLTQKPGNYE